MLRWCWAMTRLISFNFRRRVFSHSRPAVTRLRSRWRAGWIRTSQDVNTHSGWRLRQPVPGPRTETPPLAPCGGMGIHGWLLTVLDCEQLAALPIPAWLRNSDKFRNLGTCFWVKLISHFVQQMLLAECCAWSHGMANITPLLRSFSTTF